MPIYEYQCEECGVFEVEQKIADAPLTQCPECEKKGASHPVQRIISASAFHLKGGGWYKSDYAKKSETPAKTTSTDNTADTTKSEVKEEKKEEKSSLKTAPCGGGCKCH